MPQSRKTTAKAKTVDSTLPVVCLGGSAGALESLKRFFLALPSDS
jgi:chemotaxis response regulator CheB